MTTKTVSTRVDENVYKSLIDYSNQDGLTVSQVLHEQLMVMLNCNKEKREYDLECSIEKDTEKTAKFEQDSAMKKLLEELQDKNIRIKNEQVQNIKLQSWLDQIKDDIENLKTGFNKKLEEDRMKKGMECFVNDSCFPTS